MKPSYIIELGNKELWKLTLPEGLTMNQEDIPMDAHTHPTRGRLIVLCGPAGSGKSTIAKELQRLYYYDKVKFADPLKDMLRSLDFGDEYIEGHLKEVATDKLCGKSPRYAMQTLGTEWGRKLIGEDFWVKCWTSKVEDLLSHGWDVVVDDCRFDNELEAAKRLGGHCFYLVRDGAGIGSAHESERGLSLGNIQSLPVVHNSGTPLHAVKQILEVIEA